MNTEITSLRPYLRGLPIIILSMIIAVMCAKKYLSYLTPMYQSIAKIKLADIHEGTTGSNLFKDLDVFATSNKIQGEIEVIKSKNIILRTLNKIDFKTEIYRVGKLKTTEIHSDRPFIAEIQLNNPALYDQDIAISILDTQQYEINIPSTQSIHKGIFGDTLKIEEEAIIFLDLNKELIHTKPSLKLIDHYIIHVLSDQTAYDKVNKNLNVVSTEKDVAVLKIIYKSCVPEKSALFVNALAETYIEDYIELKYQAAKITSDFLSQQIDAMYNKLNTSENRIEQFKENKNIINLRQETETDLRKIAQLKIQQTNVKMSLEAIEELHDYIQKGKDDFLELAPNFEAFTDLLSTEMIKKIKELQAEKAELLKTYKANTLQVQTVDEKIGFYTSYFIESIHNTKKNLKTKYANLTQDIQEAEKSFEGLPQKEKMLVILERDFRLNENSYMFLNEKKIEADIAKAARISFHRIISKASASKAPVSPNKIIILLVAAVIGLFGSIFLIFVLHALKERVHSLSNIEKSTTIPVLYNTPRLTSDSITTSHFQKQVLSMIINGVVEKQNIIGLTSINNDHGSAFHALHISNTLISQGYKVCFLSIGDQATKSNDQNGKITIQATDFLSRSYDQLRHYFSDLTSQYDFVVVENEAFHHNLIAEVLMQFFDCNLYVVDSRKTLLKDLIKFNKVQDKYQLKNVHFVFNRDKYNPNVLVDIRNGIVKILSIFKRASHA